MTSGEKVELLLIVLFALICWLIASKLPTQLTLSSLFFVLSALLLLQSLIRDLWLLTRLKHNNEPSDIKKAQCICVESTIGIIGIVIGALLLSAGIFRTINMAEWLWTILVFSILIFGLLIKDYILQWNPWGVSREKDHINIIVKWK
ncbi:MAG: hypothetical protein ACKE9I_02510 [Methylophagaceae bacterium]